MVVQRQPRPSSDRHPVNPPAEAARNPSGNGGAEAAERAASAQRRARRAREGRGPASVALKEMRELVWDKKGFPRLTLRRMAEETGLKTTSYQYLEDDYKKDYFDLPTVRSLAAPLVNRGIPKSEIEKRLLGTTASGLRFAPNDDGRDVPVLSRAAAADVARGKLNVSSLRNLSTSRRRRLEADEVILDWHRLSDVSDETLVIEVEDGAGSQVAVDPEQKAMEEGRSYVFSAARDPVALSLGTWRSGAMVLQEGPAIGRAVPFDPEAGLVLGRVVWFMRRM